ncbi:MULTISPECIES: hypothetical protein [Pseudonocardia]|uniref:DUF4926 domain-containing protein n=2 Tax=Pseudonocardia TaxID=1847 RepID=A0A1Y2MJF7_PSEAH|nr:MULTISPECIES: hypothetical protein [Pseudonocardia]OSY35302.1 hypothetical protein BG845_06168 [Pseudonocardia autotrophica]TDN73259.1 hypothetical protein C8E95_2350 [Pseudonocardia autotrophica]BBG03993.1 hypothetical protein Pdca_52020 [Pseudonocardia autotrophica]GEC27754.1 hypothetical protein PSA01_47830 [Pseudonocardia saturnea]
MQHPDARRGQLVKFTPGRPNPAPLHPDHPGVISDVLPGVFGYVMVSWVDREGTVGNQAVYEAAWVTPISRDEYDTLVAESRELDRQHGVPPQLPNRRDTAPDDRSSEK